MQLTLQTIQRYVLKNEIPYHKVKTSVRFRFEEIEQWINKGGGKKQGDRYRKNNRIFLPEPENRLSKNRKEGANHERYRQGR